MRQVRISGRVDRVVQRRLSDVEDVPAPVCGSGDLLLESRAVGICGTDAHEFASGPHMFPIHERHPVADHLGGETFFQPVTEALNVYGVSVF